MNEIIKKEQLARKFLRKTVGLSSANPSFFVYYMEKTGREKLLYEFETMDLRSQEIYDLIDEYETALKNLEDKIGNFSIFCDFDDNDNDYNDDYCGGDYRSFVIKASSRRAYFEPIDKISEEDMKKIFKQNLTLEQLCKQFNLDPKMFGIENVSVDSCLED